MIRANRFARIGLRIARATKDTTMIEVYEVGNTERIKVTQKWLKSDSRVPTLEWPQVGQVTQKWLENGVWSHFWVSLGHLGVGMPEALLSHSWVTLILSAFLCC